MEVEKEISRLRSLIETRIKSEENLIRVAGPEIGRKVEIDITSLTESDLEMEMRKRAAAIREDMALIHQLNCFMKRTPLLKSRLFNNKLCKLFVLPFFLPFHLLKRGRFMIKDYMFFNQAIIFRLDYMNRRLSELEAMAGKDSGDSNE